MENKAHTANTEELIIALETKALELWNRGNPDGFTELSSDDIVYIDPALPDKLVGKRALERYYDTIRGKVSIDSYRMIDPVVQLLSAAAVLSYGYEALRDGVTHRMNCTEVYAHSPGGEWRIVHTHWSFLLPAE